MQLLTVVRTRIETDANARTGADAEVRLMRYIWGISVAIADERPCNASRADPRPRVSYKDLRIREVEHHEAGPFEPNAGNPCPPC